MKYKACPSCGKHVRDSESRCWNCKFEFREDETQADVPEMNRPTLESTADERPKKKCPNCAEFILEEARVCRHCGRDVSDTTPVSKPSEGLAQGMLAVPFVACLLIWFWIGSMSLLQGPGSSLALVGIATILLTAVLAGADAKQLGIGSPSDPHKGSGPVTWAIFIVLLWIFGYPAYLHRRKLYGARSYLVVGILVTLVFVASWAGMASLIEAQQEKIRSILRR